MNKTFINILLQFFFHGIIIIFIFAVNKTICYPFFFKGERDSKNTAEKRKL